MKVHKDSDYEINVPHTSSTGPQGYYSPKIISSVKQNSVPILHNKRMDEFYPVNNYGGESVPPTQHNYLRGRGDISYLQQPAQMTHVGDNRLQNQYFNMPPPTSYSPINSNQLPYNNYFNASQGGYDLSNRGFNGYYNTNLLQKKEALIPQNELRNNSQNKVYDSALKYYYDSKY